MACRIISKKGQPVGVFSPNGRPSLVFNQILNIPHIESFDQALQGYTNLLAQGTEAPIVFQTNNQNFTSLADAIKNSKTNSTIEVTSQDKSFMSIDTTINPQTRTGLINSLIKEDILTGNSMLDVDGQKVLEVTGNNPQEKA